MGDTPPQQGTPTEFPQTDFHAGPFLVSSTSAHSQPAVASSGILPSSPSHPLPPQQHSAPQDGFTSQLHMAQPQIPPLAGPFDMNTMANALPQPAYASAPYGRGAQRYQVPVPGPGMTSQFARQNTMNMMPNQQYYFPQHAHMGHFYPGGVVVGQQPHPGAQYYYPQTAHFTSQPPPNQPQLVSSHYIPPTVHQTEPRSSSSHSKGQATNPNFIPEQNKGGFQLLSPICRRPSR